MVAIPPKAVELGWRARQDLGDIDNLAENIKALGQIQPGLVAYQPENERRPYLLIAGARRLAAAKKIEVDFRAMVVDKAEELRLLEAQMAENILRKDFNPIELAQGLFRWKTLYEQAHPETSHGASGGGHEKSRVAKSATLAQRFTKIAADSMNCGETRIRELLRVAELPEEVQAEISEAPTSRAKEVKARQALSRVRRENRLARLEEKAALAEAERGDPDGTVVETEILQTILTLDNAKWFASAEEESIDLILTDPPYDRSRSLISFGTRKSISSNYGDWDKLDVGWLAQATKVLAPGAQILAFCPLEAIGEYEAVALALELTWHLPYIWHKTNPPPASRPTTISSCEAVVWISRGQPSFFRPFENAGSLEAHNFIEGPICGGSERLDHPTQKPLAILDRLLHRHASSSARVLDPFAGVCSTVVACRDRGLRCVGIEREENYAKQGRLRLKVK